MQQKLYNLSMVTRSVTISTKTITLGQILKFSGIIGFGAQAKNYLLNNKIFVNGKLEKRRGKKLFINDQVLVNQDLLLKVTNYNKGK